MTNLTPGLYKATIDGDDVPILVDESHAHTLDGRTIHRSRGDILHNARPAIAIDLCGLEPTLMLREMREGLPVRDSLAWPKIIDQIEAQTKPPRIPEPTLYGAVSARLSDESSEVLMFVRIHGSGSRVSRWICEEDGSIRAWNELIEPTLIREGI